LPSLELIDALVEELDVILDVREAFHDVAV
jgi:hypothetical protein